MDDPGLIVLSVPADAAGRGLTVMVTMLEDTAAFQSAAPAVRARRMKEVVVFTVPGAKVKALLPAMSEKLPATPVADICHLYSGVPVKPEAGAALVNAEGADPKQSD